MRYINDQDAYDPVLDGLMSAFINAVANNDPSGLLSGPDETLESHLMVFAAEQATGIYQWLGNSTQPGANNFSLVCDFCLKQKQQEVEILIF